MNHMITVFGLDQPAIVTDAGYCSLNLLAGRRTQIRSVLVNFLLRMNINTGNFYCRQYFLMRQSVIPTQVIESFAIHEVIFLGILKNIPDQRRQETYLNSRVRIFLMLLLCIICDFRHYISHV